MSTAGGECVRIESLAAGGDGVAHLADGCVVFVPGTAPGDRVELAGIERSARLARAEVGRLLEPGSERADARCRHASRCGGCAWQQVTYAGQLRAKSEIVRDALERIAGLDLSLVEGASRDLEGRVAIEVVPSPNPFAYRARARVTCGAQGIGYRRRGSHEVEVVHECPVLVPAAWSALAALRDAEPPPAVGSDWEVLCGSSGDALIYEAAPAASRSRGRRLRKRDRSGEVEVEVLGERLRATAGSFVQGNALLWDALAERVRALCVAPLEARRPERGRGEHRQDEAARDDAPRRLVELYAGIGFLSLPLARAGFSGALFESNATALTDLRANLERAGFAERFEVVGGRVERRGDWPGRFASADVLVADPPRTGLEKGLCKAIAQSGPARMVYVSCDPATLARDLGMLIAGGYALRSICALDLFPQTPHVESIVRLERG